MIAPDDVTFAYHAGRPRAPEGEGGGFRRAVEGWRALRTDEGAEFDARVALAADTIAPQVTWGTSPGMVVRSEEHTSELQSRLHLVCRLLLEKKKKKKKNT